MRRGVWPAFLALAFVAFGILGLWDMTSIAFKTLDAIRNQIIEEPLKPPAAPSWKPLSAGEGISADKAKQGELLLGVRVDGDYGPAFITDSDGALRAAGKNIQKGQAWVAIAVDMKGRVICSPHSFQGFKLAPGETITITGPPVEGKP